VSTQYVRRTRHSPSVVHRFGANSDWLVTEAGRRAEWMMIYRAEDVQGAFLPRQDQSLLQEASYSFICFFVIDVSTVPTLPAIQPRDPDISSGFGTGVSNVPDPESYLAPIAQLGKALTIASKMFARPVFWRRVSL
jgi:hypothetical protein